MAPVLALLGILGSIVLVIVNLPLLSGSESVIVKSFPLLVVLTGLIGAAFAVRIRTVKPELYASLGKAFE